MFVCGVGTFDIEVDNCYFIMLCKNKEEREESVWQIH